MCGAIPVPGGRVTSAYGARRNAHHDGVDIAAPEGTPVRSVLPGRVVAVTPNGRWDRYGITVVVDHGPTRITPGARLYSLSAHLSYASVHEGQRVELGDTLGHVGRTAGTRAEPWALMRASAAHLHLEFSQAGGWWSLRAPRLDAGAVLRELGIVASPGAPMRSACGPARTGPGKLPAQPTVSPAQVARAASSGVMGLAALAAVAWWWSRYSG